MQILTTDGGPHPSEKWAMATARELLPEVGALSSEFPLQAEKLRALIADAVWGHHEDTRGEEVAALDAKGAARYDEPHNPIARAQEATAEIIALTKGTPWEDNFARPDMQKVITETIASHLATNAQIERQWHSELNGAV